MTSCLNAGSWSKAQRPNCPPFTSLSFWGAVWGQQVEAGPRERDKSEQAIRPPSALPDDRIRPSPRSYFPVICSLPTGQEPGWIPDFPPLPFPCPSGPGILLPERQGQHRKTWGFCSGDRAPAPGTVRTDSLEEVRCSELESNSSPALWEGY